MVEPGAVRENVAAGPGSPVWGLGPVERTVVVSDEHAGLDPLESLTLYGDVPPEMATVAVSVPACPESIPVGDKLTVGLRAGLTVIVAAVTVDELSGTVAPSLTVAQ